MTLTMLDIEATEHLDWEPACEWDHADPPPATHACTIIACGCLTLYCRDCTDDLISRWHEVYEQPECTQCGQESPSAPIGDLVILRPLRGSS